MRYIARALSAAAFALSLPASPIAAGDIDRSAVDFTGPADI